MEGLGKGIISGLLFEMKTWARLLMPGTKYVAPYYPTPDAIVARMLSLAKVTKDDVIFDLGCGDGKVLTAAATRVGARGVGYELDPELAELAAANAVRLKVDHLVEIICGDAAAADVSRASVLALYLSDSGNKELLRRLGPSLSPGTRVVSFFFTIENYERNLVKQDSHDNLSVYLYKVPAVVDTDQQP
ncbi:hypothetical protein FOA52_012931 [Chlamydomonas sp. UWO 241]|nr:hypothetical protein FOA52_012931 [Chlamydomonas sp. UWO 241]